MKKRHNLIISNIIQILSPNTNSEYYIDFAPWDKVSNYNLEDYDVLFIDLEKYLKTKNLKKERMLPLRNWKLGQIIFIFTSIAEADIRGSYGSSEKIFDLVHYIWNEIPVSIDSKGKNIFLNNLNKDISSLLFDESNLYKWSWSIKQEDLPDNSYILAKNKIGDIISIILKKGKKFLVLLPHPSDKVSYIEKCMKNIEKIEEQLSKLKQSFVIKKPNWLKDYDLFNKKALLDKKNEIDEEIRQIERNEILLYGYNKPLENVIKEIFSFLGFLNIRQSITNADLICETENSKIVAEIKGLEKQAYERNVSQMFKWYAEETQKETVSKKKVKQIFICNAFRKKIPDERSSFFNRKVIDFSKIHNWGLLSTLNLYQALLKIHDGKLKKEEVISIIENNIGILKF